MRGKKAKVIRKKIYRDLSQRHHSYTRNEQGTIVNTGLRQEYKQAKKKGE